MLVGVETEANDMEVSFRKGHMHVNADTFLDNNLYHLVLQKL